MDRVSAFQQAVEEVGGSVRLNYRGRFFFEGHGAVLDDLGDIGRLVLALDRAGLTDIARARPHQDDMGLNVVFAWPLSMFQEAGRG